MSEIELITGPMYCGKTTELLRRLRRNKIAGKEVKLFKPAIDDRRSKNNASTHDGVIMEAYVIERTSDIEVGNAEVIGIEEIQFLDDSIVDFCIDLKNKGIKVIAAGLNLNFKREPFRFKNSEIHIGHLMPYAINTNLHSICTYGSPKCGEDAFYSQRFINGKPARYNDPEVLVGAEECYDARCLEHHIIRK